MAEAGACNSSENIGSVALITDSRGFGLQNELDHIEGIEKLGLKIQVFVWKGHGITEAIRKTSKQLVWLAPSLVMVLAGICDITSLNRTTRKISMADPAPEEAISRYDGQMDSIRHHLTIMLTEKPFKLVFCEMIGADMAKYNHDDHIHPQQEQLEEVVLGINTKIVAFNMSNGMPTPWTSRTVHHQKKSKVKVSRYQNLAPDGLHLGEELKRKLASTIYKYVTKYVYGTSAERVDELQGQRDEEPTPP